MIPFPFGWISVGAGLFQLQVYLVLKKKNIGLYILTTIYDTFPIWMDICWSWATSFSSFFLDRAVDNLLFLDFQIFFFFCVF